MTDMTKNIDQMINSIESNQQTIDDMLHTAKETGCKISRKMQGYAKTHSALKPEQIRAYAEYARAYDDVRRVYSAANDISNLDGVSKIHNTEIAFSVLDEMNTKQLGFMEMLCGMLEKASAAVKMLCCE
ncbi:MAG: hypothetical protein IJL89_08160 [Firmicutes bacterium]|nr:hypothetical protein [Bacillota bacterium]